MAIVTISANTSYSAIKGSLSNGDTIRIDTNAVRLTVDELPLLTNITVDSPGVSGRMTVSGAYNMSTWSVIAGTVPLIDGTFPSGATLGSATGGASGSAHGISTNAGTVIAANGGSASVANGVNTNTGTVTTATGGSFNSAFGVNQNNGTVTAAIAGSVAFAHGISANNGTVTTATGGSVSNIFGIGTNVGLCLRLTDATSVAVDVWRGSVCFVEGPFANGTIRTNIKTIYSLGTLSGSAIIAGDATVITLSQGSGGRPSLPFLQQVIG